MLQTHTKNMKYSLLFQCKNGCTNAPQCYFIRTLPVSLIILLKVLCNKNALFLHKVHTAFLHFTAILSPILDLEIFLLFVFKLILHHFNLNTFPEVSLLPRSINEYYLL